MNAPGAAAEALSTAASNTVTSIVEAPDRIANEVASRVKAELEAAQSSVDTQLAAAKGGGKRSKSV